MPLVARCWKCGAELMRVGHEYALIIATVTCPNEACGEPNALSYSFPTGKIELE